MPQVKRQRVLEGKSVVEVNKKQSGEGRAGIKKEEQDDQEDDDEGTDNSEANNDNDVYQIDSGMEDVDEGEEEAEFTVCDICGGTPWTSVFLPDGELWQNDQRRKR